MRPSHHFHDHGSHTHGMLPGITVVTASAAAGAVRRRSRGGGRRRRVFDSGELRLVLLKLIADEPRHGYELIRAIEELSDGQYAPSPGAGLSDADDAARDGADRGDRSGGARKAFAVTPAGTEHLAAHKTEVDALLARLAELATTRERTDGGPIRRAMQNLRAVLMYRFDRDDVPAETASPGGGDPRRGGAKDRTAMSTRCHNSTVRVPTAHASRYLQQLCKHWATTSPSPSARAGHSDLPAQRARRRLAGRRDARAAGARRHPRLPLAASAPDQLEALKDAVARHSTASPFARRRSPSAGTTSSRGVTKRWTTRCRPFSTPTTRACATRKRPCAAPATGPDDWRDRVLLAGGTGDRPADQHRGARA